MPPKSNKQQPRGNRNKSNNTNDNRKQQQQQQQQSHRSSKSSSSSGASRPPLNADTSVRSTVKIPASLIGWAQSPQCETVLNGINNTVGVEVRATSSFCIISFLSFHAWSVHSISLFFERNVWFFKKIFFLKRKKRKKKCSRSLHPSTLLRTPSIWS